jgi:hypothetical protein
MVWVLLYFNIYVALKFQFLTDRYFAFQSFEQDDEDQYVGSFPKDFGYGAYDQDVDGGGTLSGEQKPRILLMGLRRLKLQWAL